MRYILISMLFTLSIFGAQAQDSFPADVDTTYLNWYNHSLEDEGVIGTGVDRVYKELLDEKEPKQEVVVAVIDGGVDIYHPEFKGLIWTNEDEIPDNGIDDDNNGFIDDVHGWNFIGNSNGENILYENLEHTRIVRAGESHPMYKEAKAYFDEEVESKEKELKNIQQFEQYVLGVKSFIYQKTGQAINGIEDFDSLSVGDDEQLEQAVNFLKERYEMGFSEEGLEEYKDYLTENLEYYLNLDYNPRDIVGDDPSKWSSNYGNNDVKGPRANHGTSVAGVIAALRSNNIGIDGITNHVKIMTLRSTPDGDERDKDVANSIRYAVDNGAQIINMSFGKSFSPEKKFVDEAVAYANEKGVLLVHAAGNSGEDIDKENNFPTDELLSGASVENWIEVGASDWKVDEYIAASFSNYGKKQVDIFAPGVNILSTDTLNSYSVNNGTSLAAPVVSGVAALLLAYYPDLTAKELKEILMDSAYPIKKPKRVVVPGSDQEDPQTTKFKKLSISGGVLNAYEAFQLAEKRY